MVRTENMEDKSSSRTTLLGRHRPPTSFRALFKFRDAAAACSPHVALRRGYARWPMTIIAAALRSAGVHAEIIRAIRLARAAPIS